jgi:hypothetical protein
VSEWAAASPENARVLAAFKAELAAAEKEK